MFKAMAFYALRDGVDPDEFWKYHTEVHSVDVINAIGPELLKKHKKYVVNRVTNSTGNAPNIFGIVEMWWESKEANDESLEKLKNYITASGKNVADDFYTNAISLFRIELEEKEIPLR